MLLLNSFTKLLKPERLVLTSSFSITKALRGEPPLISSFTFVISFSQDARGVEHQPQLISVSLLATLMYTTNSKIISMLVLLRSCVVRKSMGLRLAGSVFWKFQISSCFLLQSATTCAELQIRSLLTVSKSPTLTTRLTIFSRSSIDECSGTPSASSIVIWEPNKPSIG